MPFLPARHCPAQHSEGQPRPPYKFRAKHAEFIFAALLPGFGGRRCLRIVGLVIAPGSERQPSRWPPHLGHYIFAAVTWMHLNEHASILFADSQLPCVPILMQDRTAKIALSVEAICFRAAVLATPALESVWASVLVMIGAVMMWLPQSN